MSARVLVTGVMAVLLGGMACNAREEPRRIDRALMAALGQARSLHHIADVYLQEDDADRAIASLRRIDAIRFPAGAPEAEEVRTDAHGRIVKIELERGRLEAAQEELQNGLRGSKRDTFYLAALHALSGELHEALAERERSGGNAEAAAREARLAIEAYERSIQINQRVLERIQRPSQGKQP